MIEKVQVSVLFQGSKFSPSIAEIQTGIELVEKFEIGDIGKYGEFRGKPIPFGSAILETPEHVQNEDKLIWLLSILEKELSKFYALGAEETRIYIGYFCKNQCNFVQSKEETRLLSKLDIDLWISCYID